MSKILDPRQSSAIHGYKNPNSPTFGNLKQSMLNAGYDDEYAHSIGGRKPDWLLDSIVDDVNLIRHAEKNLKGYITMNIDLDDKYGVDMEKLKADMTKFVLKTLAKGKYSDKTEEERQAVVINVVNYNDSIEPIEANVKNTLIE